MMEPQEILEKKNIEKSNKQAVIKIDHLYKSFDENHVLIDFNAELKKGENLAVLGKSGSGKSVLIKCIIGLLKPESGNITVMGKEVTNMDNKGLNKMRQKIGFLFQNNALYDSMSVKDNLEFPLRRQELKKSKDEINELILKVLSNVGLQHTIDMMPEELSGGMKKRIALARTLILEPEIILYDEPTTGLDPITGKEISKLILNIQEQYNTSSMIISHDMKCIRLTSDRIIIVYDGRCYAEGTYEELKKSSDKRIKAFFD